MYLGVFLELFFEIHLMFQDEMVFQKTGIFWFRLRFFVRTLFSTLFQFHPTFFATCFFLGGMCSHHFSRHKIFRISPWSCIISPRRGWPSSTSRYRTCSRVDLPEFLGAWPGVLVLGKLRCWVMGLIFCGIKIDALMWILMTCHDHVHWKLMNLGGRLHENLQT